MKIDVVIVNWNSGLGLEKCLRSLVAHGRDVVNQIIVVDNASKDNSEIICETISSVTLLRAGQNLGFAKACNWGAKQTYGDWILFLNPDTELFSETLPVLASRVLATKDHVGIFGAQLLDENGTVARTCAYKPSARSFLSHTLGVDRFFPKLGYPMLAWDHLQTANVDHVIGAFYLVRSQVFKALNGFDEHYFVYLEDLDFSIRAKQLGWNSLYLSEVKLFHEGGGSSKQILATRLFYDLRSRIIFAKKHFALVHAWFQVLCICFIEPWTRFLGVCFVPSLSNFKQLGTAYLLLLHWMFLAKRGHE